MKAIIATPGSLWNQARDALLGGLGENFGFFLAGVTQTPGCLRFCPREFIPIGSEDLETDWESPRDIKLEALLAVINRAKKGGWAVIENHNHGGRGSGTTFSSIDRKGLKDFSKYMLDALNGLPYGALVWGEDSLDGWWWRAPNKAEFIDRVVVSSATPKVIFPTSSRARRQLTTLDRELRHRQILLFGEIGQEMMAQYTVAIVGLGGIGSHVVQQLAYLGVERFILVDGDEIEATNLNRCVGASMADVGVMKVACAERLIRGIRRRQRSQIDCVRRNLPDRAATATLNDADIVFGCLDNDGGRMVLNRLSRASNLPYIDVATGIDAPEGVFTSAGGRVALVEPDGPCLNCSGEIDREEAAYFLSPPAMQEQARRMGYARGWDLSKPSVVSLNGALASIAVSEFMMGVTGLRRIEPMTLFYLHELSSAFQRGTRRLVHRDPDCFTCSLSGVGDKANVSEMSGRV